MQKVQVHTVLDAVLASGYLGKSARQHTLLKYLLTEEDEGRGRQLTARSIAINVLGRGDDFDSNTDSIVRVAMHKLRKKLNDFNQHSHDYTITIPKASYRASITSHIEPAPEPDINMSFASKTIRFIRQKPVIFAIFILTAFIVFGLWKTVLPTNSSALNIEETCSTTRPNLNLSPTIIVGNSALGADTAAIADNYLHRGLSQYSMVNLVADTVDCRQSGTPLYTLQTQIFATAEQPYISIIATHTTSQDLILTERIDIPDHSQNMGEDTSWAFYKTASKLANANGLLLNDAATRSWVNPSVQQDYQCLSLALMKYTHFTSDNYQNALQCTRAAVDRHTKTPEFYAHLANFYINQFRGRRPTTIEAPLAKAKALMETAEALQPLNSEVLATRLLFYAVASEPHTEEIKTLIQALEQQNAYNPHILLLISQIAGVRTGNWEEAKAYAEKTFKLDDSKANDLYYMEFAYAFLFESAEKSYDLALKIHYPQSPIATIANLAAANKANMPAHAQICREALTLLGAHTIDEYITLIQKSNYHPDLTSELIKWVSITPQ